MQTTPVYNVIVAVSKSNSVDFDSFAQVGRPCDAIYVGGAGVVAAVFPNGAVVNFTAVAGATLPLALRRVNETNTTATSMNALYAS